MRQSEVRANPLGLLLAPNSFVGVTKGQVPSTRNVTSVVALSDGTILAAPRLLKKSEAEIRTLQKSLTRKQKGSKNKEKATIALEKARRRLRNRSCPHDFRLPRLCRRAKPNMSTALTAAAGTPNSGTRWRVVVDVSVDTDDWPVDWVVDVT